MVVADVDSFSSVVISVDEVVAADLKLNKSMMKTTPLWWWRVLVSVSVLLLLLLMTLIRIRQQLLLDDSRLPN